MPGKYRKLKSENRKLRQTLRQLGLTHKVQNDESAAQGFLGRLERQVSFVNWTLYCC